MDERPEIVQKLAEAMFEGFVKEDDGGWLKRTGSLIALPSLRSSKTRKGFSLLRDSVAGVDQKRFWTKAIIRDALAFMMKHYNLEVPMTAGFTWNEWLKQQTTSVHELAQKARKNDWKKFMVDQMTTLPYNPEE